VYKPEGIGREISNPSLNSGSNIRQSFNEVQVPGVQASSFDQTVENKQSKCSDKVSIKVGSEIDVFLISPPIHTEMFQKAYLACFSALIIGGGRQSSSAVQSTV
jgi:hypothetical protein